MPEPLITLIRQIIQDNGPINTKAIQTQLTTTYNKTTTREEINSLLYGPLHELIIRDKDEDGFPVWRMKGYTFEAAKGLEVLLYRELLNRQIITPENSRLDYQLKNRRNNKIYHLDLAIFKPEKKYNIEIDGFEHIRADARSSIQEQIEKNPKTQEIDIDWMDNKNSFVDFRYIDNKKVFKWCSTHPAWCIRYHEELLKPHDITRNIWLIESGWNVIRFWNFELKEQMKQCIEQIRSWMGER